MKFIRSLGLAALGLESVALAGVIDRADVTPAAAPAATPAYNEPGEFDTLTVAPEATGSPAPPPFTVTFTNKETYAVSFSFVEALASTTTFKPPVGNPSTGAIHPSAATHYVFPGGYEGNILFGKTLNVNGTLFESNTLNNGNNYDISLVNGFSVPIVCSCGSAVNAGCNIDLFSEHTCPNPSPDPGPVCNNPARFLPPGPATPFFAPCTGGAYTYPDDQQADAYCTENSITCCIGPSCPANPKQGNQ